MSSTNASSSTSSRSSNGVTMAVMTDPMPSTGAIIPHVVEVEARDDVRLVVHDGPWPVDRTLRAGGAEHLAQLRRRVPAMHDGPVLAMTAVSGAVVHARRAGYFDMVATADGRIYFASAKKSYVIKAGPKFEVLAVNDLDGGDNAASAAVSDGRIFIRGDRVLYCIGKK